MTLFDLFPKDFAIEGSPEFALLLSKARKFVYGPKFTPDYFTKTGNREGYYFFDLRSKNIPKVSSSFVVSPSKRIYSIKELTEYVENNIKYFEARALLNTPSAIPADNTQIESIPEVKETKEIIGYRVPYDLFNGKVKAGDMYVNYPHMVGTYKSSHGGYIVPKEWAETWEPVYQEIPESRVFIVGGKTEVFVCKEGIGVGFMDVNPEDLKLLIYPEKSEFWDIKVEHASYHIGCTPGITHQELVEIYEFYKSLNP